MDAGTGLNGRSHPAATIATGRAVADPLPCGALAYRDYEALTCDGRLISVAFTLGDLNSDTAFAKLARRTGALHFGLVSLLHLEQTFQCPLVWMYTKGEVCLCSVEKAPELDQSFEDEILRYLAIFFADVACLAPALGRLSLLLQARPSR